MRILQELPTILEEARKDADRILKSLENPHQSPRFLEAMIHSGGGKEENMENQVVWGDNLVYITELLENGYGEKVDLVYVDPPFYSKSNYDAVVRLESDKNPSTSLRREAYRDSWEDGMSSYLEMLALRFLLIKELLSPKGSLWVHMDWHAVHYGKIMLDEIFGEDVFVNEVIWQYKSGGSTQRRFSRKHDTLLFYGKTKDYFFEPQKEKSYNRGYRPYRFKGVKEYRDETGWYTLVNQKDVWPIDMVGRTSGERTGYATQKPEALMNRIIESCTKPGDLCADFFAGSGSFGASAVKLGRRFLLCDSEEIAVNHMIPRLADLDASFRYLRKQHRREHELGEGIFHVQVQPSDIALQKVLKIQCVDYRLDFHKIPVDEKSREVLRKALEKDPLSLLAYWSVDLNYDGIIHRSHQVFARKGKKMELDFEWFASEFRSVHIMGGDLLGNMFCKEYRIK
ncbi:MAG TPA: site-specific DNA-methyltransferase [Bacillota bacterium]|nr:site-specific DNA-methyltransferase [Bacillota bacterium]